ncbi:co-chaperone YbbN [Listeria sp. PSOL-1]|uniref:thioredoxin family protein n=1 Tax=Listeria sp. PSOL-1 TaxID=1844999 RepID=UPI0013D21A9D|nr:thioredoxin family protein [Listeria sp. PSOL-1]
MIEIKMDDLATKLAQKETFALYFYTPICGACMIAGRMLELAEATTEQTIFKMDLNVTKGLAEKFKVLSIPSLARFSSGKFVAINYQFTDITSLHLFLQS